ncbi:hypothetical protein [Mesorhizobium sp.]|uniref:GFA family protein n=1 Tax=Mesorhizobium sp. TaxID=1871066 RepID=UPI0025E3055A|nr:hypothetical protein [Mesorhizobium sp.]
MESTIETGACFCGAIAAEMQGDPFWICFDHDDDCRRAIGSPLTIWIGYRPDQFRLTRGQPREFSKTRASSAASARNAAPRSPIATRD